MEVQGHSRGFRFTRFLRARIAPRSEPECLHLRLLVSDDSPLNPRVERTHLPPMTQLGTPAVDETTTVEITSDGVVEPGYSRTSVGEEFSSPPTRDRFGGSRHPMR